MGLEGVDLGEVLAGRYRIDRELGAGAMGVVYAAWHLELDQPVAVKVLSPPVTDLSAATVRFRREVRAAAKIRSEHVARVLDVGALESGLPYMVLELLDGNDLEVELFRRGPLPIGEAVTYVLQAIEALSEAHSCGIVHRDLKPANLFLATRADQTRIIKVLDFGISKSMLSDSGSEQRSLTQTGMIMGSPLYMSPEQMRSTRDVDFLADIWALGVILYELIAGATPFRGDSIPELCAVIFRDPPRPLAEFRDDVPAPLENAILRCLERDPEKRFADVSALARAIVDYAPQARVHSERASRVLFPQDSSGAMSGDSLGALPKPSSVALAESGGREGQAASGQGTDPRNHGTHAVGTVLAVGMSPATQAAWGAGSVPPRGRKQRLVSLGAVAISVALLVVGASLLFGGQRRDSGSQSTASADTSPNAAPDLDVAPAATVSSSVVALRATVTSDAGLGLKPSQAKPNASASPIPSPAALPPRGAVPRPVSTSGALQKVRAAAPPPKPDSAAGDALPDYGGRR